MAILIEHGRLTIEEVVKVARNFEKSELTENAIAAVNKARDYVEEVDTKTFQTTKALTKFSVDIFDLVDLSKCDAAKIPIKKLAEKNKKILQNSSLSMFWK